MKIRKYAGGIAAGAIAAALLGAPYLGGSGAYDAVPAATQAEYVLIDINTAEASELEELPGIGNGLAEAIVLYREENGPFSSIEEIMRVPGIGEGKFRAIQDSIRTG